VLNIVIPMAGAGSRFAAVGYTRPKPLIEVGQRTMIEVVIENLRPSSPHRFIFICQMKHLEDYPLAQILNTAAPNCKIVPIEGLTEGAACTVLAGEEHFNNNENLMIANSDQYVDINIDDYLQSATQEENDGFIMTMKANDPKWSFVAFDDDGLVSKVVEKKVISDEATVGIYNFTRGNDFVSAAKKMIAANDRVNNEFYVAPAYNNFIESGAKIRTYNIGTVGNGMYGLGIPEDLNYFVNTSVGKKILEL
jgi:NDP-sugar pyrophosphorylase family protein